MLKIAGIIAGVLVVAFPFAVILWVMGRSKRNTGSQHGGGMDKYRRLRG